MAARIILIIDSPDLALQWGLWRSDT